MFRYFKRKEFNLVRTFVAFCVETVSRSLIRRSVERELLSTRGRNYDGASLIAKLFSLPNFSFVIYSVTRVTFRYHLSSSCLSANERHQKRQKRNWGKRVPSSVTIRVSYSAFARTSRDRSIYGAQRFDQTPFFLLLLLLSSNVKESIVIERWIRSWVG